MNIYDEVNSKLKSVIAGEGKVAIYPFGRMGMQMKVTLNQKYGVMEDIVVDNYLADINPKIVKIDEVKNPEEYIWLIATVKKTVRESIIESLPANIPKSQIIELFEGYPPNYSNDFKVLSHIGKDINSIPAWEVLEYVNKKREINRPISVAEIGIGIGATAVEICKSLDKEDKYYAFDFEDKINLLFEDFGKLPDIVCELYAEGSSPKVYDSYNWNLSKMVLGMQEKQIDGIFDVVYLDGAHTFWVDGLACCLIKKLIKKDGYIIFDDLNWSIKKHHPNASEFCELFTDEQLSDCQIRRVVNIFMQQDDNFSELCPSNTFTPSRVVYKRIN